MACGYIYIYIITPGVEGAARLRTAGGGARDGLGDGGEAGAAADLHKLLLLLLLLLKLLPNANIYMHNIARRD